MARRVHQSLSVIERVNLLLLGAWEQGARHVSLRRQGAGIELSFLGPDGREKTERLAYSYDETVERLRELSHDLGRVQVNMAGHEWHFDAVVPASCMPDRVFLHMRPGKE